MDFIKLSETQYRVILRGRIIGFLNKENGRWIMHFSPANLYKEDLFDLVDKMMELQ